MHEVYHQFVQLDAVEKVKKGLGLSAPHIYQAGVDHLE
jgi:hypothetical protein